MPRLARASGTLLRPAWIALLVCVFLFPCSFVAAHPVPRRAHDRTIAATLAVGGDKKHVAVTVAYRLEVDEATVVLDDLPALGHKIDLRRAPNEVDALYQAFTDSYAPILAGNLLAKVDNELLQFRCSRKQHRLKDEAGVALNHLRCDFVFQAEAGAQAKAGAHEFTFREGNYEFEEGLIRLSLVADPSIAIVSKTEPDAALQALPPAQLRPGDDARLRTLRATFASAGIAQEPSQAQKLPEATPPKSWW